MIHSRQHFATAPRLAASFDAAVPLLARPAAGLSGRPYLPILDEPRRSYTLDEAYTYCRGLARTRYENVPVASRLLPETMRPHVLAVYAFIRAADDFADEPVYEGKRHFALDQWEHELFRTFHGEADHPIFVALRHTIEQCELPLPPFSELLTGFRLDLQPAPYVTFEQLRTYCRHRSETLGQIVLGMFGYRDPALLRFAADVCTALQLVTFLQDLGPDLDRGRIYIPREDLRHFGISEEQLKALQGGGRRRLAASSTTTRVWRDLVRFQSARARSLLERGRPLLDAITGDLSMELELAYLSGRAMLDKIDALGEGVLRVRPMLGGADRARVMARALGHRWPQWLAGRSDWSAL